MKPRRAVIATLAAAALAGCGTSDDHDQAQDAVSRFYAAIADDRGEDACAELSVPAQQELESQSEEACAKAVIELELEGDAIASTRVFATNALVDLRNGDSVFLSREAEGWKLSAVGCKPEEGKPRDRPFHCELET